MEAGPAADRVVAVAEPRDDRARHGSEAARARRGAGLGVETQLRRDAVGDRLELGPLTLIIGLLSLDRRELFLLRGGRGSSLRTNRRQFGLELRDLILHLLDRGRGRVGIG